MPDHSFDVIIIGAGLSGLAAGNVLSAESKNVLLLEGRPRCGGRVETMHDPAWTLPIERGAEFIHGKPPETWDIVRAGACCLYDITDHHWIFLNGRLQKRDDFFEHVEKVLAITRKVRNPDLTFNDALKKFGARFNPDAKRLAKAFIEGFDAADTSIVSSQWLNAAQKASDEIDGDRLFRVHAGYDRIVHFLRSGLEDDSHQLELNTLVRRIEWSKNSATVHAVNANGDIPIYTARHVLITVPVGVLQLQPHEEGHIAFVPELPPKKRAAINHIKMGPVVKVLLRFRDPFWEEIHPDLSFFHSPNDPFPTWWTTLPLRSSILTAWSGGPAAAALSKKSEDAILTQAITTLSKLLKLPRRKVASHLLASHVCNWQTEPLSRGAYSYAAVNGSRAPAQLATPIDSTLFFAGEAAHSGMSGTVAGAIASGHHAAHQILHAK
jgi:monoamine oxidase